MIFLWATILVLGVLIFVHELGHYLAARSVGVRVEKFYLGFNFFGLGWKTNYKGTEYGIGLFPLGGYVKVAGIIDESMDVDYTGSPDEFCSKNTFEKKSIGEDLPSINLKKEEVINGINIVDLVITSNLLNSKNEVRRMIKNKGIKVNNIPVENDQFNVSLNNFEKENFLKLSHGKKKHVIFRII